MWGSAAGSFSVLEGRNSASERFDQDCAGKAQGRQSNVLL